MICPICGMALAEGEAGCSRCGLTLREEAPAASVPQAAPLTKPGEYDRLGGILILVAIGMVIRPFLFMFATVENLKIFTDGTWQLLAVNTSESYMPGFGPLVLFETAGHVLFVCFSFVLLPYFFMKKKKFPALIIVFIALNLLFILADNAAAAILFPDANSSSSGDAAANAAEVGRAAVLSLVWIGYFHSSKRVKGTFVR